jgi:beta-lactamase regulating signal transducer with metallopeptidase domain
VLAGIPEYAAQAIVYSILAIALVEGLLYVWKVQNPPLDIAFRLLAMAIPPAAPIVFAFASPERGSEAFRKQTALLDLQNWLGPEPSISNPIWLLLLSAIGATTALMVVLNAVGFFRRMKASRPRAASSLLKPPVRLTDAVNRLASRKVHLPPIKVVGLPGPTAFTAGLLRPSILVSPALVDMLDDEELEAVLAHESAHVARQDNWLGWLTFAMRIVSFYNPVIQFTYHQIGHDVERVCDSEAGRMTGKPLALASALIKVFMASRSSPNAANGVMGALGKQAASLENRARHTLVEDRAERLVHPETVQPTSYPGLRLVLATALVLVIAYLVV